MPAPVFVRPPVPVSADASVTLLPFVSSVPPPAPRALRREETSVVVPPAHCRPPPLSVALPAPRLARLLKLMNPALTVVPPV